MAQMIQDYAPAYTPDQLKFDKFRSSFADKSHYVWTVYDSSMDQLIVRLIDPSIAASEYYITDSLALLVRDYDRQVVGYTICDFQSEFLPKAPKLEQGWKTGNLEEKWQKYSKQKYEPKARQAPRQTEQHIFKYSAFQIKGSAEAELVPA